jgi:hypothetical protein
MTAVSQCTRHGRSKQDKPKSNAFGTDPRLKPEMVEFLRK